VRDQILAAQKELTGLEVTLHQYRAAGPEFRPAILRHLSNIHSVGSLRYRVRINVALEIRIVAEGQKWLKGTDSRDGFGF
jgi:hypothetical protein